MTKCKCGREFEDWDDYKYHFFHECSKGPKEPDRGQHLYRCKHCGEGFKYAKKILDHEGRCVEKGNELMKHCQYCFKIFTDAKERWFHELDCPEKCEPKFKCEYCCMRIGGQTYYYNHIGTCRKRPSTPSKPESSSGSYYSGLDNPEYYEPDPDFGDAAWHARQARENRQRGTDFLVPPRRRW